MYSRLDVFETKKSASTAVISGVILTLLYKVWTYGGKELLGLSPQENYHNYELFNTAFRYLGGVLAIILCFKLFKTKKIISLNCSKLARNILVSFLFLFFIIKVSLYRVSFSLKQFSFESLSNLSVGIWEEFAFKGLIMTGLCRFVGVKWSVFLTSLYFTLWHVDTYPSVESLFHIFLIGFVFSLSYVIGCSLFFVSIAHFILNQLHFGFIYLEGDDQLFSNLFTALEILTTLIFFRVYQINKEKFKLR